MRPPVAVALLIAFWSLEPATSAFVAREAQFRSGVQTVSVYATVSEASGRFATNLTRDDFRIRDNGRPVDISVFSSDVQPITVAVMLGMSGSMAPRFMRVRAATLHFVDALLPLDRASIGTFGSEVFVSPMLTGDKAVLKRVIEEELWPGGGTPLWAGIDEAMKALSGETGRRIVLALTDGKDSGGELRLPSRLAGARETMKWPGNPTLGKVRKRAVEQAFMVYAIGLEGGGLDSGIIEMADETGGGHFQLQRAADLNATYNVVGPTPLWNAIAFVADELKKEPGPRAIILLTDGRSTGNRIGLRQAAEVAVQANVAVNVVVPSPPEHLTVMPQDGERAVIVRPSAPLSSLAEATGGTLIRPERNAAA